MLPLPDHVFIYFKFGFLFQMDRLNRINTKDRDWNIRLYLSHALIPYREKCLQGLLLVLNFSTQSIMTPNQVMLNIIMREIIV
jgi:hypothetical protein